MQNRIKIKICFYEPLQSFSIDSKNDFFHQEIEIWRGKNESFVLYQKGRNPFTFSTEETTLLIAHLNRLQLSIPWKQPCHVLDGTEISVQIIKESTKIELTWYAGTLPSEMRGWDELIDFVLQKKDT